VIPLACGFMLGFRRVLAQPGSLTSQVGFFVAILVTEAGLWHAAIDANRGQVAGYSWSGILWYVFGAQAAVSACRQRLAEEVGEEIGSGSIVAAMLRPVSVVGMRMATEAGEATVRLTLILTIGTAVTWAFAGPPPSLGALFLAGPVAAVGCGANLAFQHAAGGAAFWLADAKSAWFLYQKLIFLPGGMLIPLELLPGPVQEGCRALPFAAMAYVPGRIASGHVDWAQLVTQATWLVILALVASGVFRLGERRLRIVGG
jgi:ABC-2 type transport system permease protein